MATSDTSDSAGDRDGRLGVGLDQIFDDTVASAAVDSRLAQLRDVVQFDHAARDELSDPLVVDRLAMTDDHDAHRPRSPATSAPPIGSVSQPMC